jgi:hypothetical protein
MIYFLLAFLTSRSPLLDDHQSTYFTKLKKKTLVLGVMLSDCFFGKFLHHADQKKSGRGWGELKTQRVFSEKSGPEWPHL